MANGAVNIENGDATGGTFKASVDSTNALKVTGTVTSTPSGTQAVNLTQVNGTAHSATNPAFVRLTDGTDTATINAAGSLDVTVRSAAGAETRIGAVNGQNALGVYNGSVGTQTFGTLTGDSSTATFDAGAARGGVTFMGVGTGTLTGTLTLELSTNGGTNWASTGATVALTAAGTVIASTKAHAARHWRVTLSSSAGTGSVVLTGGFVD